LFTQWFFSDRLHQTSKLHKCCFFSRCLSEEFSGFSVIVWLRKLSEYVDIHYLLTRHGKSLNCSQYAAPIEPRSHGWLGAFYFYMWEIPFTLVFTFLFFLIFWDCVTARLFSLLTALERCRRYVIVTVIVAKKKRNCHKKPNLCLWRAWKFPQIRENSQTYLFLYK